MAANKKLYFFAIAVLSGVVAINFWIFGRFTVDDAFITWRFGKNLVLHGIWNYNPSTYDMTQAYTNPLYAFLSILPAFFHWDVVLFFKIFSVFCMTVFGFCYAKKTPYGVLIVLIAYALPQTMIHAFSGLETFLFIALLTMLLVSIYEKNRIQTLVFSALLLYTRPEALALFAVIPLLYGNWKSAGYEDVLRREHYTMANVRQFIRGFITRKAIITFLFLILVFIPYLAVSYLNFGNILPNTFFVKNGVFSLKKLVTYATMLLPILFMVKYLAFNQFFAILFFFAAVAIHYARTDFLMDYALRSTYHILVPIGFFYFYVHTHSKVDVAVNVYLDDRVTEKLSFSYKRFTTLLTAVLLVACLLRRTDVSELLHLTNYYYRTLSAHAEAGKVIRDIKATYDLKTIACGDAGMLAFHADMDSLDLLELGSASLVHNGLAAAYGLYKPDVLFLHGNSDSFRSNSYMHDVLTLSQADDPSMHLIGKITWLKDYYLWVYSNVDLPDLTRVFEESYAANFKRNRQVVLEHIFYPPLSQWHE